MKYTHDDIVWHVAPSLRPCPNCQTLVHTLSAWDEDLGPLCPRCHPGWQYVQFQGQRPIDVAADQWQTKLKARREQARQEWRERNDNQH